MDLGSLFGGIAPGPNGTFLAGVRQGGAPRGLAGEPDVMQISGMPSGIGTPPTFDPTRFVADEGVRALPTAVTAPPGVSVVGAPATQGLRSQLMQPITIGPITLPLAGWLAIAALLGGAGGYYLGRR